MKSESSSLKKEIHYDFDYIVVGSGFGGSVSALRLSQKGYKVAVIESGKRWNSADFPKTNWNLRKFLWFPKLFCFGIQRINFLNDVMVLSGAGVGGGSLVYANTLYVPPEPFWKKTVVHKMGGRKTILPFYELAKKMLGVVENPRTWEPDKYMQETAKTFGIESSFIKTPVGVHFGKSGVDPYFGGEGPERNSCNDCGGCMVGCRYNAKNTLDKNYLYFAEKAGAVVVPETKVSRLIPLSEDGSEGYELQTEKTTSIFGSPRRSYKARGVVLSAGVLGTLGLLLKMKEEGILPNLSKRLGHIVRTNSESLIGVTLKDKKADLSHGIAITSSVFPDEHTHIEPVRYSNGSDAMNGLAAGVIVDGGGSIPRQLRFLIEVLKHPVHSISLLNPIGFARRTIILLVMQTVDNSIEIIRKRRWIWPFQKSLSSTQETGEKIPTYIPIANEFARRLAKITNGVARSSINEALLDIPATAHILGGCNIAETPEEGVVDLQNRVFGYQNLRICDGSMIPANLGVNPSLTITALSERAMSFVPLKEKEIHSFKFEKRWGIVGILGKTKNSSPKKRTSAKKKKK
ncbi:GMC family oxidoreductase [Leptospira stimsonii]|uniref:Cholesterol oxidase n=1 Tax=Leptospira stimsonii TaxID=2202203 RepID=A0A4R9L636_9LEPT|nr:GMC family oxidoreductase [Leptospira stimsonii]RHX88563.1 cholesterol oxidase [Leptospira stimsonii]TGK22944.1 GMC family oxidoreductase [Leptospira stimsonii]TGM16622.1 GMC family oxidoreductase [Leptospira stimsonii]